ncbi:MAG: hypothetical protein ACI9TV_001409 [Sulfurimonas sp.]|jgi:hypothetical protein|uniref:hypothetical protein n=1 Tax=Sulfurimonas sp. TaxID=2022749 RepID=UPI0039E241F0
MDISLLIQFFVILVIILGVLLLFFFRLMKAKKNRLQNAKKTKKKTNSMDLKTLRDTLKDKKLSITQLQETMDLIIKEYGDIDDYSLYADIILRMTHHPSANKEIIISFDRELSKLNPHYASSISHSVTNGLSSR